MSLSLLAQLATENSALYTYGPLGIFCAFFMWREVKREAHLERDREAIREGFEAINHTIRGLSKAMWTDLANRSDPGSYIREEAKRTIERMNAQEQARPSRPPFGK